jgi:hypothetical protein
LRGRHGGIVVVWLVEVHCTSESAGIRVFGWPCHISRVMHAQAWKRSRRSIVLTGMLCSSARRNPGSPNLRRMSQIFPHHPRARIPHFLSLDNQIRFLISSLLYPNVDHSVNVRSGAVPLPSHRHQRHLVAAPNHYARAWTSWTSWTSPFSIHQRIWPDGWQDPILEDCTRPINVSTSRRIRNR